MSDGLPEWMGQGSVEQKRLARAGYHPTGQALMKDPGFRKCGNCFNLVRMQYAKTYLKCKLTKDTRGPATDVRSGWPACVKWAIDESGIPF